MSQLTTEGIKKLIATYAKTYKDNPSIMLSGYGQENQTVADYNGRQILELMQNADDAKSEIIAIQLDTEKQLLSIANNGTAFSLEGVESLMYTGLSTKNKVEFIGNKGLGFRSILNWVHQVSILTKEVSFRFSKKYSEQYFDHYIAINEVVRERIQKEIEAKKLTVGAKPIAALAFPEIVLEQQDDFVTKVVLDCKIEELSKIEEQIDTITEETLLFLPHIKKIMVNKDGEQTAKLIKTIDNEQEITINNTKWNCYRSSELLYDTKVKFKYAIAWKDDWDVEGIFFNYFPTDVTTDLPCIIHATFDLTNNRKEINDNAQNAFILNEIVNALGIIAEQHLKTSPPDWRAYQFLTPKHHSSRKVLKTFFDNVSAKRESIACYPTLDGHYATKEEVVYHGEVFSTWVEENEFGNYFPRLLKKPYETLNFTKRYSVEAFSELVQGINLSLNLDQRIALIGILANNENGFFNDLHSQSIQLPLLLNTKGDIVPSNIKLFTKDNDEIELEFSHYKDIEFISTDLFNKLRQTFREEIKARKLESESGDARAVKRFLDPIINIGLDDITGVIQHIVVDTNKKLKTEDNQQDIIQQMVHSLYSIFISNSNRRGNLTSIDRIPLLSRSIEVKYAEDLYFGKEYTVGIETEKIFEGIKNNNEYLASNDLFNINGEEHVIVNFFKWLNVNQYTKFETIQKNLGRWEQDEYSEFILSIHKEQRADVYKNYSVKSIKAFGGILKNKAFSIEKLIAWIAKDEQLLEQLRSTSSDQFYIQFGTERKDIQHKPSYILFQILTSGITNNIVASMPLLGLESFKVINPHDSFFTDLKIPEYKLQEIVDLLHIKNSFNDLNPGQIYQLLRNDQRQFEMNSQSFYKLLYDYFRANEKTQLEAFQPDFTNIEYYCRKGGLGKNYCLIPLDNVYYSDNKLLPQKILDNYWFINLPKRTGENRVAKFFGVQLIKDIIADIQFNVIKENEVSNDLNDYINRLKPYWLSYRLEALKIESDKKEAARNLKQLKIQVVKEATYTLSDGQILSFDDFDFIPKDNLVVIKYSENSVLDSLRYVAHFCDVIAEIVCVIFKVADFKNTYRRIFKDGVKETLHILKSDEKESLLDEAKKLLGISEEELSFWKKIFPGKVSDGDNEECFLNTVTYNLGLPLPDFYKNIDFSNLGTKTGIDFLKWLSNNIALNLDNIITVKTLEIWHKQQFNNCIKDYFNHFEQLLWIKCVKSSDRNEKENFFNNLIYFDNESTNIYTHFAKQNIIILEPKYSSLIIKWVADKFQIDLQLVLEKEIDVSTKYKNILKEYSFGESIDDMEKIIKSENPPLYSLMYFEGFENEIKLECDKQATAKTAEYGDSELNKNHDDAALIIVESSLSNGSFSSSNGSRSNHKGSSYNSKGDRKKASSGKKQEDKVKNSLLKQGYLVNHVSTKTDAKHYDLEYKKEGDTEWRFLEVKKDSGGYFFLSKAEKETAISKINVEKYDIAIVGDNTIHIIKSPFNFNDESFEQNTKFYAEPTEYKINFKIEDHKN